MLCKFVHFRTKPSQTKLFETGQLVGETTLFLFHIGKKIWILDRRIHFGLAWIVPANVDLEARVRRERQESGRPEVPLKSFVRFPASCLTVYKNVAALFSLSGGSFLFLSLQIIATFLKIVYLRQIEYFFSTV